jgi:hypothetical protein
VGLDAVGSAYLDADAVAAWSFASVAEAAWPFVRGSPGGPPRGLSRGKRAP